MPQVTNTCSMLSCNWRDDQIRILQGAQTSTWVSARFKSSCLSPAAFMQFMQTSPKVHSPKKNNLSTLQLIPSNSQAHE